MAVNQAPAGRKGRTRTTGVTGRPSFTWGRAATGGKHAPASSQLDWAARRAGARAQVRRAATDANLEAGRAGTDYAMQAADRGLAWAQNRAETGLTGAGDGVGRNRAVVGRQLARERTGYLSDTAAMGLARQRRVDAANALVEEARQLREDEKAQILLEMAAVDPQALMRRGGGY